MHWVQVLSFFLLCPSLACCAILPTSFKAMTGRTAPSLDGPFAEVFRGFPQCTAPRIVSLSPISLVTDVTLEVSGLWLGTRTGTGGTATLA